MRVGFDVGVFVAFMAVEGGGDVGCLLGLIGEVLAWFWLSNVAMWSERLCRRRLGCGELCQRWFVRLVQGLGCCQLVC